MPAITAVVPTYSRYDLLTSCIEGLLNQTVNDIEIVVVDNASMVNISDSVKRRYGSRVTTMRLDRNLFFCGAVNRGASIARGEFLAVINDDCVVDHCWAEAIVSTFRQYTEAASIASLVLDASNPEIINSAGDHLDISGRPTNLFWNRQLSHLPLSIAPVFSPAGSCAVYRRELFALVGGFDNDFIAYVDDIDLGFRLQLLGFTSMFNPQCSALHVGGGTYKPRKYAAYLLERNMIWNLAKNLPSELWRRHYRRILAAQSIPAPLDDGRSAEAWMRGKAAAALGITNILKKRRHIQAGRRASIAKLEALLLSKDVARCHL